jgi:hypothetical protein
MNVGPPRIPCPPIFGDALAGATDDTAGAAVDAVAEGAGGGVESLLLHASARTPHATTIPIFFMAENLSSFAARPQAISCLLL